MQDSTTNPKRCSKCGNSFPATTEHFHRSSKAGDGLRTECKQCRVGDSRKYYENNAEKIIAYVTDWQKQNYDKWYAYEKASRRKNPFPQREKAKRYAKNNPEKSAAHGAVKYAVRVGKLPPVSACTCLQCGQQAQCYHHWSYKPEHRLEVIPLCSKCHHRIHAEEIE